MNNKPLISIIIVNFNGLKWLKGCFQSLKKQTYENYQIIFVDNASKDGSVDFVRKNYPKIKIVQNEDNFGFAEGNNIGYKFSSGKYILLLNNDTDVEKDYLENFLKVFKEKPKAGIVQSKILLMKDKNIIDSCGSFWTDTTFMYYVGNGKNQDIEIYNKTRKVFSVKGASMLIKREVIEKIGLFDDDFWNYYEETDFCHRAWLAGYESWYWPYAVCYHALGGTSLTLPNNYIQYHNFKNKLMSFLKNYSGTTLLYVIPVFMFLNVLISLAWLLQGKYRHVISLYRAIWWNVKNYNFTLEKRRKIQKLRKISDRNLLKYIRKNPKPVYYFYLFRDEMNKYLD